MARLEAVFGSSDGGQKTRRDGVHVEEALRDYLVDIHIAKGEVSWSTI